MSQDKPQLPSSFWCRVLNVGNPGCWEWAGARTPTGYGHIQIKGRTISTHRLVYQCICGPIPKGLTIDHLCRNRLCVNPEHLEAVTFRENTRRGTSPIAKNAKKTRCPRNHPLSGPNLRVYFGPYGPTRYCLICKKAASRRTYLRKKNKHAASA